MVKRKLQKKKQKNKQQHTHTHTFVSAHFSVQSIDFRLS